MDKLLPHEREFWDKCSRVHSPAQCGISVCVVHNPSQHHMRTWPLHLRYSTLVERICSHGVGHPDPDSLAFFVSIEMEHMAVHGCCGCCTAGDAILGPRELS